MSVDKQTIQSYNNSAEEMAAHFLNYTNDSDYQEIKEALKLIDNSGEARVVEIGCGAGKDAANLVSQVGWYEGFDPSEKLLEIAKKHVPVASFVQADALTYKYPKNIDAVFAFASLLHLNKEDFAVACNKVASSLKPGGVFVMVLKEAGQYVELYQNDDYGTRLFYLYPLSLVIDLVGPAFKLVSDVHTRKGPKAKLWMSLIFIKQ